MGQSDQSTAGVDAWHVTVSGVRGTYSSALAARHRERLRHDVTVTVPASYLVGIAVRVGLVGLLSPRWHATLQLTGPYAILVLHAHITMLGTSR